MWKNLLLGQGKNGSEPIPPLPSRLLTDEELKPFYEAIKTYEASNARVASDVGANVGAKRKSGGLGGLDTQHYGRGKRAREVGLVYSPSFPYLLLLFPFWDIQILVLFEMSKDKSCKIFRTQGYKYIHKQII